DSAQMAGEKLKARVAKIKAENPRCKKVILVTHSMGGLVARSACSGGLAGDVLAVVHTVQPVTGAPAAYWRMKSGFRTTWRPRTRGGLGSRSQRPGSHRSARSHAWWSATPSQQRLHRQ